MWYTWFRCLCGTHGSGVLCGTHGSGVLSSTGDVLEMSVVRGVGSVLSER